MSFRRLLLPLTPLYRFGLAMRERRLASGAETVRRLRHPVISIGNLSTGGSGKTPLAIALARALSARGFRVDVLSRGYGRTSQAAARVRADGRTDQFGDEPLLIAREAGVPVYVAAERHDAGLLAESEIPAAARAVHILDDGFQHRQLHRDIDILLLNDWDLRDRLLPAGNLREPLEAMHRTTALAIPADDTGLMRYLTESVPVDRNSKEPRSIWPPVWRLRRRMEIPPLPGPVLAFCGIGRPQQFFAGLESAGVVVAASRPFRDHFRYTQTALDRLGDQARSVGAAALLTTDKDQVRLGGLKSRIPILTAGLRTEIENEAAALDWLISRLEAPPSRSGD